MRFVLYILFLLVVSCKPMANKVSQSPIVQKNLEPQIGFYFFEAVKTENEGIHVYLSNQKIVEGKLKGYFEKTIPASKWIDEKWLITFLNPTTKNLIQLQISNPLNEEIEYVNEAGNFEKKTIYLDKKEFIIRIPYTHSIKTITFEELTSTNNSLKTTLIDQISL